jgi:energy-coupling factor transporter transmembrane protein EcfT
MYDPLSKFIIKNAAYFLIVFLFIEVVLLPLSIMNIVLLVLLTIIVIKMLYCETRIETYRSLANVLQVLNIFAIIYIFTKYMFLYTQYTQNIQLKNSIENGYHQHAVNENGTLKVSDPNQEHQKTEDARNQLHHSHDHDNESQSRSFENKLLEKMFGF